MQRKETIHGRLLAAGLTLLIGAGAVWGGWRDEQPKFHDVTISAGETEVQLEQFLTEYAVVEKCAFVTDTASIDYDLVGQQPVTLRSGLREQTVTLTIQDTLAPELTLRDLDLPADTAWNAEDFVAEVWDHSQVTVSFAELPAVPEDYRDITVEVLAADAYGNTSSAQCTASFRWLREEAVLEYGQTLNPEDLLYGGEKDAALLDAEELEAVNTAPVGEYEITSTLHGRTLSCHVTVQDTCGPVLELKERQIYPGSYVKLSDFISSAEDPSGEVTLRMMTEIDTMAIGTQTVVIEAEDIYGNITCGETTLYVATDFYPPAIYGAGETLVLEKHSEPDYLEGVTAQDAKDGAVEVTCDAAMVDTSVAGTYYITYTARDSSGNVTTLRRKVTVNHDQEDTDALVLSIAESLEDDPELIRDYVRKNIHYSSDWGGDDPVWSGFTNRHGNCYVHALCLKAILDLKGYNTQLIWVTAKTHYWLIIEIEPGVWRHIDATPSDLHSRYSLMTDDQRYWTLSGRDWDRSAWPACE